MRIMLLLALFFTSSCAAMDARNPVTRPAISARPIPLDNSNPARSLLGRLRYLGGLELQSIDPRFGGFSSLKWSGGRLHSVTDTGDWISFRTIERGGRLEGVEHAAMGDLLGLDGEELKGNDPGDAEGLTRDGRGWLVSFEHEHKILRYPALGARAQPSGLDPTAVFGALEENQGVETIARRNGRTFVCAERLATEAAPNCYLIEKGRPRPVQLPPPPGLDPKTAFPVDADWGADGTLYILMRSWSGGNDQRAAILARSPRGKLRVLGTFVAPVRFDNFEGLAMREVDSRTFLYIISDDNFHVYDDKDKPETWHRTQLMKFELVG